MKYLLIAIALAACNPQLYQHSAPPPGRSARLDRVEGFWGLKRYRLEVSQGVAVALTCQRGGPCEKVKVVSDNPGIAEVRPASLSALEQVGYAAHQQQPSSAFVVLGKAPGTTKLHVTTRNGKRDIDVTVVAPPSHGAKVASSSGGLTVTDSTSSRSASLP